MEQERLAQLEQKCQQMQSIIDYTPGGMHVCCLNAPYYLEYASDGLCRMLGYSREEFEEVTQKSYAYHMVQEDVPRFIQFVQELANEPQSRTMEYRLKRKDGSEIYVSDTMESKRDANGVVRGYSSVTDISVQKTMEQELIRQREKYKKLYQELKANEERFRLASSASGIMFFEYDLRKQEYVFCENVEKVLGATAAEIRKGLVERGTRELVLKDYRMDGLVHPEDLEIVQQSHKDFLKSGQSQVEVRLNIQEGSYHWYSIRKRMRLDENGTPVSEVGCVWNVDHAYQEIAQLKLESSQDPMSGLMNKVAAYTKIGQLLRENPNQTHAMLFMDLDDFKLINDTQGHSMGDKVIRFVADALRQMFRSGDVLARFGGDEFIVFLPNTNFRNAVCERAQRFNELAAMFGPLQGTGITLSASIGVAFSDGTCTVEEICAKADRALYQAKEAGKCQYAVLE